MSTGELTIADRAREVEEEFALFGDDWESKYGHLVDLGKTLAPMPEDLKTDDRLIKGCQSRVWLNSEMKNNRLLFTADSDAIITKGIIGLLVRVLGNQKPEEIVKADLGFIHRIGLQEHLSPTRANGLVSMINTLKAEALKNI